MSDDLVKRLRGGCSCNIDSTPCMAEDECRAAFEAANYMEEAAARIEEADRAIANLQREYDKRGDRIEALERERDLALADDQRREWEHHCKTAEAALAKAVEALQKIASGPDDPRCFCGACVQARTARATLAEIGGA